MCWYNSVIFSCEILLNTFHLSFFTHLYHISPGNWSFCDDSTTSPPLIMIKLVETKTNTLHLLKEVQYIPGIAIKTAEIYININKSHKWPLQNNTDGNIWPVWDWMFIKRQAVPIRQNLSHCTDVDVVRKSLSISIPMMHQGSRHQGLKTDESRWSRMTRHVYFNFTKLLSRWHAM